MLAVKTTITFKLMDRDARGEKVHEYCTCTVVQKMLEDYCSIRVLVKAVRAVLDKYTVLVTTTSKLYPHPTWYCSRYYVAHPHGKVLNLIMLHHILSTMSLLAIISAGKGQVTVRAVRGEILHIRTERSLSNIAFACAIIWLV